MQHHAQRRLCPRRVAWKSAVAALVVVLTMTITSSAWAGGAGAWQALSASPFASGPSVVLGLSPSESSVAGGRKVRIHGKNLIGANDVSFGGVSATIFSVSASTVVAINPPGTGVVDVTVTTPLGTSAITPADQFKYNGHPPGVSGISPKSVPAAGGVPVNISGANFYAASAVHFGPVDAPSFTVNSDASITAVAPAETAGTIEVMVTTPYGTSPSEWCQKGRPCSVQDHFKFTDPTITELNPSSGTREGGTSITITGTGFAPGATGTGFVFGSTDAASVSCESITTCTVLTPAHKAGSQPVLVKVNGMKNNKGTAFRYTFE